MTLSVAPEERVNETRRKIQADAAAMGIDHTYLSTLVDTFYGRIREHDILGPIFSTAITDWEPHLATMKRFWTSVALNTGEYSGKPVPAHRKHVDMISPSDFAAWLTLFRETLDDTAPTIAARDYFMVRAERIANSLQLAMFGAPGLGRPRYA